MTSQTPDIITIRPARRFSGTLSVPGDKSISHRALMLAALAEGDSEIRGLSTGQDVQSTAACLRQLGVRIESAGEVTVVSGRGRRGLQAPEQVLDAGNSGTTMRLLAGILAGQPFATVLDGDASLRQRPMRRIAEPLQQMGAKIEMADGGTAPLRIAGGDLHGITYPMPVASAQVKSCLLLAGLFAEGETEIIETLPTRDHTERMLAYLGVPVQCQGKRIRVQPAQPLAAPIVVPGDFSSAAYFIAAALLIPDGAVTIRGVGVNPTRSDLLRFLVQFGADIEQRGAKERNGEAMADLHVRRSVLQPFSAGGADIPLLIDEIPILAVLATQAEGTSRFRDAGELRVKESDRLRTIAVNLQRMGAAVVEHDDGLEITGPVALRGADIESYGDHRIAMAFSIAGLIARGETRIHGASAAAVSFPEFFDLLQQLSGEATG